MVQTTQQERVSLISTFDFTEKTVLRDVFDKGYFITFLDEMPLYVSPSPELLADYNNQIEGYARAASLCV